MKRYLLTILLGFSLPLCAQKVQRVCGEFTYYAEGDESPNQAKAKALEGAKLQAIAAEFGTVVSQSIVSKESSENGMENSYFSQLSASEVKGEWLENVGEAEYKIEYVQEMLAVTCKVCGKAREITNEAVEFEATVLKNGTEKRFADTRFRNGDDLYLQFRSPVDGYVAVYLVDETPTAYCLLPYLSNAKGQQSVKHGENYIFFSPKLSKTEGGVDEFTLTCENNIERNQLYIIFSPKPFTKALDDRVSEALPRQLAYEEFSRWLGKSRRNDSKMGLKVIHLEITK